MMRIPLGWIRKHVSSSLSAGLRMLLLLDIAFVFIFPFLYLISTAIKSPFDLANPAVQWVPGSIWLDNFQAAITGLNYWHALRNSIFVTAIATIGHVIACSFIGYGFARYEFRLKGLLMFFLVITILVPPQLIIIPEYILFARIGWINTYAPLLVPVFFGFGLKGGLFTYLSRQHYHHFPKELEEAGRIDGCGPLKIFFKLILPISKPAILVMSILSIVWHWNDTFESTIFVNKAELYLVSAKLPRLYDVLTSKEITQSAYASQLLYNEGAIMAATLLVILPVLIIYFLLQKQFMEGIERSGIVG